MAGSSTDAAAGGEDGTVGVRPAGASDEADTIDRLLSQLDCAEVTEGNSQASAMLPGEVPDVAVSLLDVYRSGPARLLAFEGYLDLSGNAWGCVVEGDGWTDVAVVQARAEGGSAFSVTRMYVAAWAEDPDGLLEEVLDEV